MQSLQITVRSIAGVQVVVLSGAVDALSMAALAATLGRLLNEPVPRIVLDCRKLGYIGSAQLRQILDFAREARAGGGDIKCAALAAPIQQVATLLAGGDPMECYEDVLAALAAFHEPASSGTG
jgi:anti-anti-sigma factor